MTLFLTLRPHINKKNHNCHVDQFDILFNGEVLCTSNYGWKAAACELLERGYSPDTLLHIQHEGTPFDPTIVPRSIGEWAE